MANAYLFHGLTIFLAGFAFHFHEVKSHDRGTDAIYFVIRSLSWDSDASLLL
jgi:hypothetical protein